MVGLKKSQNVLVIKRACVATFRGTGSYCSTGSEMDGRALRRFRPVWLQLCHVLSKALPSTPCLSLEPAWDPLLVAPCGVTSMPRRIHRKYKSQSFFSEVEHQFYLVTGNTQTVSVIVTSQILASSVHCSAVPFKLHWWRGSRVYLFSSNEFWEELRKQGQLVIFLTTACKKQILLKMTQVLGKLTMKQPASVEEISRRLAVWFISCCCRLCVYPGWSQAVIILLSYMCLSKVRGSLIKLQ